jgi:hypothetical protein
MRVAEVSPVPYFFAIVDYLFTLVLVQGAQGALLLLWKSQSADLCGRQLQHGPLIHDRVLPPRLKPFPFEVVFSETPIKRCRVALIHR